MIRYQPRVGEILVCNFGHFKNTDDGSHNYSDFDGRIYPEMVKNRMVMVVNAKLGELVLVVPLSTTKRQTSINTGMHIPIDPCYVRATFKYPKKEEMWAKCEALQLVSKHRLFKEGSGLGNLPREVVTLVQLGIIKAINAKSLLKNNGQKIMDS